LHHPAKEMTFAGMGGRQPPGRWEHDLRMKVS
jgi:hypothetical protein